MSSIRREDDNSRLLSSRLEAFPDDLLPVSRIQRRIVDTADELLDLPDHAEYLHAVLCQVGMPRRSTAERIFERKSGNSIVVLEAGRLMLRGHMVEQPLPYGACPRLIMVHLSTQAVRRRDPLIPVGSSMREFLVTLGIDTNGGPRGGYTTFKKQMQSLAACRLTLGLSTATEDITINTSPIRRFDAWVNSDQHQQTTWPGVMELSHDFYETLLAHAVPLDPRALAALKHSALALDIYTWLAHRLCRIRKPEGNKVYWANLQEQFGQEYKDQRNFKKEFRQALKQTLAVYRDARVEDIRGGMILKPSPPPIPRIQSLGRSTSRNNP